MLSQVYCAGLRLQCPELIMDTVEVARLMDLGKRSDGQVDTAQGADSDSEKLEVVWDQPTYEQLTTQSMTALYTEDNEAETVETEDAMDEPLTKRLKRSSQ